MAEPAAHAWLEHDGSVDQLKRAASNLGFSPESVNSKLANIVAICGVSEQRGLQLLLSADFNEERAINFFFAPPVQAAPAPKPAAQPVGSCFPCLRFLTLFCVSSG
mgnify:CR=1 FL=1